MLGHHEAAYLKAASKSTDPNYLNARNSDFETFDEEEYLKIIATTNRLVSEESLRSTDDLRETVIESHDQIQLVMNEGQLSESELLKWSLTTLESLRRALPQTKKKSEPKLSEGSLRKKSAKEKRSESIKLNQKILRLFRSRKSLVRTMEDVIALTEERKTGLNIVNAATISFELGKACNNYNGEHRHQIAHVLGLVAEIVKASEKRAIGNKSMATLLFGLQHFDNKLVPEDLLESINKKMEQSKGHYSEQAITMGLVGILPHQNHPAAPKILRRLLTDLEAMRDKDIHKRHLPPLVQALSLLRIQPPMWLQVKYILAVENGQPPTKGEAKAAAILREIYPDEVIAQNFFVDGFELDVYLPLRRLNIEMDGSKHSRRKLTDKRRDDYLREARGIRVVRIKQSKNKSDLRKKLMGLSLG